MVAENEHLTELELEMALDNLLPEDRFEHLQQCEDCLSRLAQAKQSEYTLKTRLYRQTCPSPDTLADFEFHALSAAEYEHTQLHVARCPRCQEELAVLRGYLNEVTETQQAPKRARSPYISSTRTARSSYSGATLGLRGISRKNALHFDVADAHIFLEIDHHDQVVGLTGQIISETEDEWERAVVAISQDDSLAGSTITNAIGEFQFEVAQTSPINLRITNKNGVSILLEAIQLANN